MLEKTQRSIAVKRVNHGVHERRQNRANEKIREAEGQDEDMRACLARFVGVDSDYQTIPWYPDNGNYRQKRHDEDLWQRQHCRGSVYLTPAGFDVVGYFSVQ